MKSSKRWSLRTRLLVGVLALVFAGFVVADVASVQLLRSYLTDRIDEQLYLVEGRLAATDPAKLDTHELENLPERARVLLDAYTVEFLDPTGKVVARWPMDTPALDLTRMSTEQSRPFHIDAPHHPGYRAIAIPRNDGKGTVILAYDLTGMVQIMARFVLIELAVTLVVLCLVALLGVAMIRVGLRPLTEVEQTAEEIIAGGDLSRRVPVRAGPHTEMGRLSRTLNTMLTDIEGAVVRMRRFVADASHELRTPVASIRGLAELHRQGAVTDPAEVSALIARIESEATRMGLLVEDLVLLARLDEERPLRSEPVDLVPVAVDVISSTLTREVQLELLDGDAPVVQGDEDRLHQVVTNLVGNAVSHTPPGTPIVVRVGVHSGQALLEVVDHGPGIPEADHRRIFERFYRADPARSRDHERSPATGSGLGLSIVAALVAAHGGTVSCGQTPGGGATFTVLLPLLPD